VVLVFDGDGNVILRSSTSTSPSGVGVDVDVDDPARETAELVAASE
jgi:hypothetical protein